MQNSTLNKHKEDTDKCNFFFYLKPDEIIMIIIIIIKVDEKYLRLLLRITRSARRNILKLLRFFILQSKSFKTHMNENNWSNFCHISCIWSKNQEVFSCNLSAWKMKSWKNTFRYFFSTSQFHDDDDALSLSLSM